MTLMSHIFAPIIANLQSTIEQGGYLILFIITIIEGIPAIGSLIPGHTVVILSGFLAKLGIFNLYIIIPLIIIGAMIGDLTGYFLGKKYGYNFLKFFGKFLFIKEEYIEKTKSLINTHTGKSIIIGRFNPITRPLAPFIIGASHVHMKKFWFYDFVSVFLWTIVSVAVGYAFGASYHVASGIVGKFIFIAIIIAILITWGYSFINKRFHIFAKYELFVLFFNLLGLYGFFKTIQDALRDHAFMAELDIWVNTFFSSHSTSAGLNFMNIFTNIFSPSVVAILTIFIVLFFIIKRKWEYALISILSVGGGLFINAFIKELVLRIRPIDSLIVETGYSFPSGHATAITIFFTLIIYLFIIRIKNIFWREILISISVFLIILTAVSRLYLGVHWLSDVIAGCTFGLFWTTLIILFVRYIEIIFSSIRNAKDIDL